MGLISVADLNEALDNLCLAHARCDGDGSTWGVGQEGDAYGSAAALSALVQTIIDAADEDVVGDLLNAARTLKGKFRTAIFAQQLRGMAGALSAHLRREGGGNFTDLESALLYYNTATGTKWQTLQHPRWREIWNAVKGGSTYPARSNLYFEVKQGSTYANALRKLVVGTGQTAGASIADSYAGGFPRLNVSGFTGTSDTVTVTGTAFDPATKTASTGKTWTATVSTDGSAIVLAPGGANPAATDSLILACSGIVAGANILASTTIYVEAHAPTSRIAIPA